MWARRGIGCVASLAIVLASVADNAATCRDDAPGDVPGACAEMPCHTPILFSATASPVPLLVPRYALTSSVLEPASTDAPPPPTPPPTVRA